LNQYPLKNTKGTVGLSDQQSYNMHANNFSLDSHPPGEILQ